MTGGPPDTQPTAGAEIVEPAAMRTVLGHFATGIAVVTAIHDGEPVGFTCQSFSSLSLEPPLVAFFAASSSQSFPRIRAAGRYCVNVLHEDQEELCRSFARTGVDKFAGRSWRPSAGGSPVLDGVLAWVDCTAEAEHAGGDHTIAIGRVLGIGLGEPGRPLLFWRGQFARLGGAPA